MGMSKVVAIKASICFMIFALLRHLNMPLLSLPFLHATLVDFLVAIASLPSVNLPLLLGKTTDGKLPLWSLLLFSPYLFTVRLYTYIKRIKRKDEAPYCEISQGLYLGGWPSDSKRVPPGDPAIVDCTCELPRSSACSKNAYMCIPTWDTRSPQPMEMESAVRWACRKRAQNKPVYIHCAFGHGRSVSVMCALLVALGLAEDWKAAEKIIKERRPHIRMNALHRKNLEEWSNCQLSTKASENYNVSPVIMSSASRTL